MRFVAVKCLAVGLAISLGGCGGGLYQLAQVRGTVMTCEGKPATGGTVIFYPVDDPAATGRPAGQPGREARGVVGADGSFTLTTIGVQSTPEQPGAVTGKHKVAFEMPPTKRPTLSAADKENMTPDEIKKNEAELAARPVYPPLPCSDQITPAEVTVERSGNNFEFNLPPK